MKSVRFAVCLVLLAIGVGCNEEKQAHYATAAQAEKENAFEDGWLPGVLRADTTDIEEFHDLDSNQGGATFRYGAALVARLQNECTSIPPSEVLEPVFDRSWPKFLRKSVTPAELDSQEVVSFRCEKSPEFFIAIDSRNQIGYMW